MQATPNRFGPSKRIPSEARGREKGTQGPGRGRVSDVKRAADPGVPAPGAAAAEPHVWERPDLRRARLRDPDVHLQPARQVLAARRAQDSPPSWAQTGPRRGLEGSHPPRDILATFPTD